MILTLSGNVPSKKNSRNIFRNKYTGKQMNLPSEKYYDWHTNAGKELLTQWRAVHYFPKCEVEITFYPKTHAKADLTNKAESILDLLVDMGIISDDNWFVVTKNTQIFGGVDKENPRAEIKITKV